MLKDGQSASGHFDAAGGIERGLWRNSVSPPHQEYLEKFGGFEGVDHTPLEQIVPQGRRVQFS